mmetsp:Transcript_14884/g.27074  ORF Transcript_14884/g.27074 Transcript_14884/m.27074 type:complete len:80 (+) Transcript_14884:82-321(+)
MSHPIYQAIATQGIEARVSTKLGQKKFPSNLLIATAARGVLTAHMMPWDSVRIPAPHPTAFIPRYVGRKPKQTAKTKQR